MKFEFFQNISFLKASGINEIVAVEIYSTFVKICLIKNKKALWKFKETGTLKDIEIINSRYDSIKDYGDIKRALELFISSNKIKEPQILIGLNEYKFATASVPNDVEDVDIWFSENLKKFLPEGRPADEFNLIYDKFYQSENYFNFAVDVVRSDYLAKILEACQIKNGTVIAAFPFPLSFLAGHFPQEADILYIDFSDSKIIYAFKEKTAKAYIGEIYKNIYEESEGSFKVYDLQRINENALIDSVNDIKNIIENSFGIRDAQFDVYASYSETFKNIIESAIKEIFGPVQINANLTGDPLYMGAVGAASKVFNHYDETSYHLPEERKGSVRFELEKKLTLNFVLIAGLAIIMFMIISLGANSFLVSKISEDEETVSMIEAKDTEYQNALKENKKLNSDIEKIASLRNDHAAYSDLLREISELIPEGCSISEMKLKNLDSKGVQAEIKGLSSSQTNIAEFIENMESSGKFKNVSLLYSNAVDSKLSGETATDALLQFGISAGYHED